jgi:hypothetical protein
LQVDARFGSIKASVALGKHGYKTVLQVNIRHSLFPKIFKALQVVFGLYLNLCMKISP